MVARTYNRARWCGGDRTHRFSNAENAAQLQAGAGVRLSPMATAGLYFSGMLGSNATDNAIETRLAEAF